MEIIVIKATEGKQGTCMARVKVTEGAIVIAKGWMETAKLQKEGDVLEMPKNYLPQQNDVEQVDPETSEVKNFSKITWVVKR